MKIASLTEWFICVRETACPHLRLGKLPIGSAKLVQLRRKLLRKLAVRLKSSNGASAPERNSASNP